MNLDKIKNIHFVGIGGIGMSGIAEILTGRGMAVSGCDLKRSSATALLTDRGVNVRIGHDAAHLAGIDTVVVTAAVKGANAEVDAARERGIDIVRRKDLLSAIVDEKRGIGVSGTHGKTTTSAMIATVLEEAGLDPLGPLAFHEQTPPGIAEAAPAKVAADATIVAMEKDGMRTVRAGTNGFTCMADNPATPGPDPMCMDAAAMDWANAWMGHKDPSAGKIGFMYMLAGGTDASNTDPYADKPTASKTAAK